MRSRSITSAIAAVVIAACFTCTVSAETTAPAAVPAAVTTPVPAAAPAAVTTPATATTPAAVATPTQAPAAVPTPTQAPIALKTVDLVIFAGQSNMSGRGGDAKSAPSVPKDTGYEFRYGSCATGLYPVTEPFGIYSNGYLCDPPALRGGSLVSSFMNAYYKSTGVPVLGFSAARGGTSIAWWQTPPARAELLQKYEYIRSWCAANHIYIRRSYVVWLQGETDGVANVEKDAYKAGLSSVFAPLFTKGLEQVFVITIGRYTGLPGTYDKIIAAQKELCATDPHFTLGSDALMSLPDTYSFDGCHYNQAALNIVGSQCGQVAAARSKLTP